MARDLTSKINSQYITDTIGGGVVEMFYRMPTTEERIEFRRACMVQVDEDVKFEPFEARIDGALKVLTGYSEGYFTDGDTPISADPKSEHYRENWKVYVKEAAPDLLEALGMAVFEGARLLGPKVKEKSTAQGKPTGKKEGEDPLGSNSGD